MDFTDKDKISACSKARIVDGYNENLFRKDACGAWIAWEKYGLQDNDFGWEIDHIYPKILGGDESPDNLRALQHQNNASKGNDYPSYTAAITSQGNSNIEDEKYLTVNKNTRERLKALYKL